jgi:hypothetical protein
MPDDRGAMIEGVAAAAAALLHAGPAAAAILDRIGGLAGQVARTEAGRMAGLERPARAQVLARRIAELRSPVPVGLALVHRDWIDPVLAEEGARVRDIVSGAAAVAAPVRVWLERRVYGAIASIAAAPAGAALTPETLAQRPAVGIDALLRRAGVTTLALALDAGVGRAAVAAVAARLGDAASALIEAVAALSAEDPAAVRARHGSRRAAARRAAGVAIGDDRDALLIIGARAFAPHIAGLVAQQIAQRLPRAQGERLLVEVSAFAGAADGPSWDGLVLST